MVGVVLAMLACSAHSARAQTVGVVMLGDSSLPVDARLLEADVRKVLRTHTLRDIAPPEAMPYTLTEGDYRTCAGQVECFASKVATSHSTLDEILVVSVRRVGDEILIGLRRVDVAKRAEVCLATASVDGVGEISEQIEHELAVVYSDSWGQFGQVDVIAEPVGAEVSVGASVCLTPCTLQRLPVGDHDLRIRALGYEPASVRVRVEAGGRATTKVELRPEGGAWWQQTWFWVTVGSVATVGVTAGIVFGATDSTARACVTPRASCE